MVFCTSRRQHTSCALVTVVQTGALPILRNWHDELRDLLVARHGEAHGLRLTNRFGKALPHSYIEQISAEVAADDVCDVAALGDADDLRLRMYRAPGSLGDIRLKLFRRDHGTPQLGRAHV